jgi:hypothetical protein
MQNNHTINTDHFLMPFKASLSSPMGSNAQPLPPTTSKSSNLSTQKVLDGQAKDLSSVVKVTAKKLKNVERPKSKQGKLKALWEV